MSQHVLLRNCRPKYLGLKGPDVQMLFSDSLEKCVCVYCLHRQYKAEMHIVRGNNRTNMEKYFQVVKISVCGGPCATFANLSVNLKLFQIQNSFSIIKKEENKAPC